MVLFSYSSFLLSVTFCFTWKFSAFSKFQEKVFTVLFLKLLLLLVTSKLGWAILNLHLEQSVLVRAVAVQCCHVCLHEWLESHWKWHKAANPSKCRSIYYFVVIVHHLWDYHPWMRICTPTITNWMQCASLRLGQSWLSCVCVFVCVCVCVRVWVCVGGWVHVPQIWTWLTTLKLLV